MNYPGGISERFFQGIYGVRNMKIRRFPAITHVYIFGTMAGRIRRAIIEEMPMKMAGRISGKLSHFYRICCKNS